MNGRSPSPRAVSPGERGKSCVFIDRFGKRHLCDSHFERRRAGVLDRAGYVLAREAIVVPYVYGGRRRTYRVDWLVKSLSGKALWAEEDKPLVRTRDPINLAKFAAARAYCRARGIPFKVVTEREAARP